MDINSEKTYSESWHRVANLRIALHPAATIRKQLFRGQKWYVIHDQFNNNFFRLQQPAYNFISRLNRACTVGEIWQQVQHSNPQHAPLQDEIIRLLAQLYQANVLLCELPVDSVKIFERYRRQQQQEHRNRLLHIMFFRIPLFDPDAWLNRSTALVQRLTGRGAFAIWTVVLLLAGKLVLEQLPLFISEAKNILGLNNLILLYAGLVLIKLWHELGHTLVCKHFGGEVHTVGVMFMIFTPLPYMDATSSWAFRQRRQRILVALAGMIFELFAAACAAFIWAATGPGMIHSLALNMLIVGSISSIVFNGNPLLRYDGYYALSDALDIPNLQPRSIQQLKYLSCRYLLGARYSSAPESNNRDATWLTIYALLSGSYRVVVYGGIILFVADRFLIAGALMALLCVILWGFLPLMRFFHYLFTSPDLMRNRWRAVVTTFSSIILIISLLGSVPIPNRFRAPGVIESCNYAQVNSQTSGRLVAVLTTNGTEVVKGQPLLHLENTELGIEIRLNAAQRSEVSLLQQQSTAASDQARITLNRRLQTLEERAQELSRRQQQLLIRAETEGIWCAPDIDQRLDSWLQRGERLGQIVSTDHFKFIAIIKQKDAAYLFANPLAQPATIRLSGLEQNELNVEGYQILPFKHQQLPSAALGWKGGGDIPVDENDALGLQTLEPFFQISAIIQATDKATIRHGHSGKIRFSLRPKPVLTQLYRQLNQFVQKRYQI
jgi:putative peptide zinc metalloprotease protein